MNKREYIEPVLKFETFERGDILTASTGCSTPETTYYEGVNTYAGDLCFDGSNCD